MVVNIKREANSNLRIIKVLSICHNHTHTQAFDCSHRKKEKNSSAVPREGEITSPARHFYSTRENRSDLASLVSPSEENSQERIV